MGQRGVTAHEQQDERVVPLGRSGIAEPRPGIGDGRPGSEFFAVASCCVAADVVRHAPGGHVNQPAARVVRHAFLRPLHAGGDERLLYRVFGGGEVLEAADRRAENLRRELAQQILGSRVQSGSRHISTGGGFITSRTSIGIFNGLPPTPGAADAPAAIS